MSLSGALHAAEAPQSSWQIYKERFISPEGRVVDDANASVSHSESQGYGLLLAQAHGDRATFESIWAWTTAHLRVRDDQLFAWRWKPGPGKGIVDDRNNASDGDILIAWALQRAAASWQQPSWRVAAGAILHDVRTKLLRPSSFGPLLLPGSDGFEKEEGIIVNLSYWLFPAFRDFRKIDPAPEWEQLEKSGLSLLKRAQFSPRRLPPDWAIVSGSRVAVAPGLEAVYGYNAVRVPLHLAWGDVADAQYYRPFREFASSSTPLPATITLPEGTSGKHPALPGMLAIYRLIAGENDLAPAPHRPPYPAVTKGESYFSASLGLLSNQAALESGQPSTP